MICVVGLGVNVKEYHVLYYISALDTLALSNDKQTTKIFFVKSERFSELQAYVLTAQSLNTTSLIGRIQEPS